MSDGSRDRDEAVACAYPMVLRCMALYTGDGTRAEQIATETATQMYGRWSTVRRLGPSAWALRYAYGLAQRSAPPTGHGAAAPSLAEALRALAPEPRMALATATVTDLTPQQRAWVLGHRPNTIERWTDEAFATLAATPAAAGTDLADRLRLLAPPPPALDLAALRPRGQRLAHRDRIMVTAIVAVAVAATSIGWLVTLLAR